MEKTSNKLVDLSISFAVDILNLVKFLKSQHETIISNQIGKADFISKLQIALKEANEKNKSMSYNVSTFNKSEAVPVFISFRRGKPFCPLCFADIARQFAEFGKTYFGKVSGIAKSAGIGDFLDGVGC